MATTVETLYKTASTMVLGWNREPVDPATLKSYKLYVGLAGVTASLNLLASNISPRTSDQPAHRGKVVYEVSIQDIRTLLGLPVTVDFTNVILFYAVTYVNQSDVESSLANSIISESLPVGIMPKQRKDDPTTYRQIFGFSDNDLRWVKAAASPNGGLIVDNSDFYKANIITEYTYTGTGDVSTAKSYLADRTASGSPAKLVINEYSGGDLVKTTVTDSTV